MMKTVAIFTVLCSCAAVTFAANETVAYKPDVKDTPSVDVAPSKGSVRCYSCSFFRKGTKLEGNENCEWDMETMDLSKVEQETCDGYCVKDWLEQSALTPYLYVSRYCAQDCKEGTYERYEEDMVRTCCKGDLCNSAGGLQATLAAVMFGLLAFSTL